MLKIIISEPKELSKTYDYIISCPRCLYKIKDKGFVEKNLAYSHRHICPQCGKTIPNVEKLSKIREFRVEFHKTGVS